MHLPIRPENFLTKCSTSISILAPLAQRWQLNREHIQAIEKIFSEFLVSNVLVQIAIGRGDNPDVDVQSSHSAEPFKLSVLQDSQ
jgi:hypothetical protein